MKTKPIDRLRELNTPTGTEKQLDITFPDNNPPRLSIQPKHGIALIAAVLLIGVVIVGSTLFTRPPVPAATPIEETPAQEEIVISVVGAVAEPGLVTLAPGARIADAITAAGGLTPEAQPHALNQAQLLVDGQQIHVPDTLAPPPEQADGTGKISLNSADAAALTTLKGVGEATAAAIISYREEVGGFSTLEQLMEVSGIGPAKYAALEGQITL